MSTEKGHICFLVPMFNEELVIQSCLDGLTRAGVSWEDVYLVNDGSTDNTHKEIELTGFPLQNVFYTVQNRGKAQAMKAAFRDLRLQERYNWVNCLDADSILDKRYLHQLRKLIAESSSKVVAICSQVKTKQAWNPFVAYRAYEYAVTHHVYKEAQHHLNMITVLPGCGSCYRTDVFAKAIKEAGAHIITEDMEWTIQIHEKKWGKVIYSRDLQTYTQDPQTLHDYSKQMTRWFRGTWQVFLHHKLWKIFQNRISKETSFLLAEGLFFSITNLVLWTLLISGFLGDLGKLYLLADALLFVGFNCIAACLQRDLRIIAYLPTSYLIRNLIYVIFLKSFVDIVIRRVDKKQQLSWNKVARYNE